MGTLIVRAGIMLMVCAAVAGCGESNPRESSATYLGGRLIKKYPIKYAPNGRQTLARERLPGGYISLVGERYAYMGQAYLKLSAHMEELGKKGLVSAGGGGTSIKPGEYGASLMQVERGCFGRNEYTLVYGLLRDRSDTVTARGHRTSIVLKRVAIPADLHAGGILVYTVLGRGPIDVVTQTPSGRVVNNESYPLKSAICG